MDAELIKKRFQGLFQKELVEQILTSATAKTFKEGRVLIDYGRYVNFIPLVVEGSIKIIREDQNGHELFLYYLGEGDTCAFSLSCCMNHKKSEIKAITETDATVLMVPLELMDQWMEYSTWREFVFSSYQNRFDELLQALDSVAFMKLDERLYNYLLDIKQNTGDYAITRTHQQIADDLNTSRVVISRILKKLTDEDKIEMYRNKIEIL